MTTPLPPAGDPLALLRPRGKAAPGRAGPTAATAATAAQQRAAQAAAGGTATAAHPAGAARALSFAQLLGRAGEERPAAGAGLTEALQLDSTQRPARSGEDDALGHADAPLDLAALSAATDPSLPPPTPATATVLPTAPTPANAQPAQPAADSAVQPGAGSLASEADALQAPHPVAQAAQALPRGAVHDLPPEASHQPAQPLAGDRTQSPAREAAAPTAARGPGAQPAEPAAADAVGVAPTPLVPASDIDAPKAAGPNPAPAPDSGATASRAWQAIDQAPTARAATPADSGGPQPVHQPAGQPAERAAVAMSTAPAAPALAAAQAAAAGAGRTARAAAAAEGKPETPVAASANNASPGTPAPVNSPVGVPPLRPSLQTPDTPPQAPIVARSSSPAPAPAPAAPDTLATASPSRAAEAAPELPLPQGGWFVPPAPAAAAAAVATSALASEAQASLAAHPQSPAFAPELGAQLTHFARNGVEHARLALNPAEMGPVTVQIQLDGSNAQVHLSAEHALTRQALEQAMPQLAGSLREAGLTLSGGGVFEQPRQGRDAPDGQPGRTPLPTRGSAGDDAAGASLGAPPALRRRGVVDLVA